MPTGVSKRKTAETVRKSIAALCPTMSFSDPAAGPQQNLVDEFNALKTHATHRALETLRRLLDAMHDVNEVLPAL